MDKTRLEKALSGQRKNCMSTECTEHGLDKVPGTAKQGNQIGRDGRTMRVGCRAEVPVQLLDDCVWKYFRFLIYLSLHDVMLSFLPLEAISAAF